MQFKLADFFIGACDSKDAFSLYARFVLEEVADEKLEYERCLFAILFRSRTELVKSLAINIRCPNFLRLGQIRIRKSHN